MGKLLPVFGFLGVLCVLGTFAIGSEGTPSSLAPAADCHVHAGTLPFASQEAGKANSAIPIEHIIVLMQENHSFDNYFGKLNAPEYYGSAVDGLSPAFSNPDRHGKPTSVFHQPSICESDPHHSWNAMHADWNNGQNNGFAAQNGSFVMGYYDSSDIPFYYALANTFAIGDRYFSPMLGSTFPNRFFLMAATAFGHTRNDKPSGPGQFSQPTIFDALDKAGVSWGYYRDAASYLRFFRPLYNRDRSKIKRVNAYQSELRHDSLPQVVFLDAPTEEDEHPHADIQLGQKFVADRTRELMASPYWKSSAIFLEYDEGGGFFDHAPPPAACIPDNIPPELNAKDYQGQYDRYGFRVPFVAISPYAKRHFVSHVTYDHTSILKFIETKFNLPALTRRDANADAMLDLFDFEHPDFSQPTLPSGALDLKRLCI